MQEKRIPHPIANDGDDVSDLEYLTPNRLSEMVRIDKRNFPRISMVL